MKVSIAKAVFGALLGGSMLIAAGVAGAAKAVPGSATVSGACDSFAAGSAFQDACMKNQQVADGSFTDAALTPLGAYVGSCAGGGACADSVYNKLASAAAKFAVPKVADGCANLASIQSDLLTWNTAAKQKIDNAGYATMSAAITAIQTGNCY